MTSGVPLNRWLPDVGTGAGVLALGLVELLGRPIPDQSFTRLFVVLCFAVACGLVRHAPGVALAIMVFTAAFHLLTATPLLITEFAVAIVAFGCARYGHPATVVVSGLLIPIVGAAGLLLSARGQMGLFFQVPFVGSLEASSGLVISAITIGSVALAVPWLAGLVVRSMARAQRSHELELQAQAQAEQAREVAALREKQTRLAHDVHDVVGHSLAVILAQADSGQYLDDPERLKAAMATIAGSARGSLRDVRQVLSDSPQSPTDEGFASLVEGLRAAGRDVHTTVVGSPQPIPPELATVAHRVTQEMLTNAVRHGVAGEPILVQHHWPDPGEGFLRIEVRNTTADPAHTAARETGGLGIQGMRQRLDAVGGRLDVHTDGAAFTAVAWVPVRPA